MFSDYVEVSGAEVPSQTSVESAEEPELSETGVQEGVMGFGKHSALEANDVSYQRITCATDCYHRYSNTPQRLASARSQGALISVRLKEKTESLDSTQSFLDDDSQIKTKRQLDDLTTAVNKKRDLIVGLRSLLRTFEVTDLEQILTNHEAELKKLEVNQAEVRAALAALPEKVAKIHESRAKVEKEATELGAQERACRKELLQCSVEEKALQVWEKVHGLCLCGLAKMEEKDLQVILLNLDAALHKQ
jgi:chromosome segregation ATPase